MNRKPPDLLLEQYVLGELPEDEARELEQTPGFEERVARIRESNRQILSDYPADVIAKRIRNAAEAQYARTPERTTSRSRIPRIAMILAPSAALAVVAFFLVSGVLLPESGVIPDPATDIVRLKGSGPSLEVFWKDGPNAEPVRLEDGAIASAGDELQVIYDSAAIAYGTVVSLDGRGSVTLHYPSFPSGSTRLESGGSVALPRGFTLDDAPVFERFYFVTSDAPIDVERVIETIDRQKERVLSQPDRNLDLPADLNVTEFTVRKE